MKDNKKIQELIKLSNENPDLEIKFMINEEVFGGDDCIYWLGGISKVFKGEYWINPNNDLIYVDDDIEDQILYCIENNSEDYSEDLSMEEIDEEVKRLYNEYKVTKEIKEAIFVYIDPK